MSGTVRAVHQSSSKLGDTPLLAVRPLCPGGLAVEPLQQTLQQNRALHRSSLYNGGASSRGGCRALQLYSAPEPSTSLQLYGALHSTSSTPYITLPHSGRGKAALFVVSLGRGVVVESVSPMTALQVLQVLQSLSACDAPFPSQPCKILRKAVLTSQFLREGVEDVECRAL